jgi:hypothetical protein
MDLLEAAGDNPGTRWCLTVQGQDGTAAAHGCVPGRRTLEAFTGAGTAAGLAARLGVALTPVTMGACQHAHAEPGYTPSRKLRHLIQARNTRCTAPGCGRPAAACDLDHTIPWDDSHLTCECNIAPLCRVHHQIKQAQSWKLEQPAPGVLVWTSPSGLTRTTTPSNYQNLPKPTPPADRTARHPRRPPDHGRQENRDVPGPTTYYRTDYRQGRRSAVRRGRAPSHLRRNLLGSVGLGGRSLPLDVGDVDHIPWNLRRAVHTRASGAGGPAAVTSPRRHDRTPEPHP